jgi:hypothetical protein
MPTSNSDPRPVAQASAISIIALLALPFVSVVGLAVYVGARDPALPTVRMAIREGQTTTQDQTLVQKLRKAVTLTVVGKSFEPANATGGRYEERVLIECEYNNISGKDIRAFTGKIRFTDLFGKPIFESGLTISDPIRAGAKAIWSGSIRYNQFSPEHQALRDTELQNMKIVWLPSGLLFADGTKIGETK